MDTKLLAGNVDAFLYGKNSGRPSLTDESFDIFQSITGVEASDGVVIVSREKSALFVDGRYALAAKQQADPRKFEILSLKNDEIIRWMKKNLPSHGRVALDYRYYTHNEMEFFAEHLKNVTFVNTHLDRTFNIPSGQSDLDIYHLNGKDDRLPWLRDIMEKNNLDAYLLCDPCSIAWLLDVRDLNRKYTPVIACNLLITQSNTFLYLSNAYRSHHQFKSENDLEKDLAQFSRIGMDKSQTPFHIQHRNFVDIKNPCILPRALKNEIEIDNIKRASIEDSEALVNFLYWFHNNEEKITELTVVEKILQLRKQQEGFVGESFKTIAAADEHSAIIHYYPSAHSNKVIDNILLLDSGGQYKHGTTDISRTLSRAPTEEQKFFYTLVLKGHIALAGLKFPQGTGGGQIDSLARQFLQQYSADYDHSTGHGIGYMSHVHEGPMAISKNNNIPLQPGMILSNEPGYYRENSFGIRLENMMLVAEEEDGGMSFEIISLVPFDGKFIDRNLLTEEDVRWLRQYNQTIISTLKLQDRVLDWLRNSYLKDFL
jgi:Xaa-Pro aminopeptidase